MLKLYCGLHGKFVSFIPLRGTHSKWPRSWALVSPLGEEYRGSWAPSHELFLNGDVAPLGVNFEKQILVSFVLVYLISLLVACETSFLGFELDLLTHEFLVNFICWISTLRNPWYSFSSSIYFSIRASCSFISGCSNPETPDIAPDTPDHQTRSIRAYTRSIRDSLCLTLLLSVFKLQIAYSPPL